MSTTAIDVSCFSDANFDVKKWINSSLSSRANSKNSNTDIGTSNTNINISGGGTTSPTSIESSTSTTLEQDTATMITKLQLAREQTSRQVGALTDQVIKSMPRLLYEIKLITDDAQATQQGLHQVKKNLGGVELGTDGAFDKLRQLHLCKTRMEECLSALMEAENWNNLESEVSKVMNNHDFEGAESRLQDALSYLATTHQTTKPPNHSSLSHH